jgi:hypothetical protein
MEDNQGFIHQVALAYDGETLRVSSTESVDYTILKEMLTTALKALEAEMSDQETEHYATRH